MQSPIHAQYRLLDQLVDLLDIQHEFGGSMPGIQSDVAAAYRTLTLTPPSIEDFTSMLDSSFLLSHALCHKGSWIMQRLLEGRPCCVNQKILLPGQDLRSPLVEQIALRGFARKQSTIPDVAETWTMQRPRVQQSIDALLVRRDSSTVSLVKVVSFSQVRRRSNQIRFVQQQPSLFGEMETNRILENAYVAREVLGSLIFAREVLEAATVGVSVRLFILILDDAPGSWKFQCHEVSAATPEHLESSLVALDEFSPIKTTRDFGRITAKLIDRFASIPSSRPMVSLNRGLKENIPVDRATRCLMMLNWLFDKQRVSSDSNSLGVVSFTDLTDVVESEYEIFYPKDQRRHDVEDCLWRGGFIDRVARTQNAYAIKPKGLMRVMIMKPKYNPMVPAFSARHALSEIGLLGEIWRKQAAMAAARSYH